MSGRPKLISREIFISSNTRNERIDEQASLAHLRVSILLACQPEQCEQPSHSALEGLSEPCQGTDESPVHEGNATLVARVLNVWHTSLVHQGSKDEEKVCEDRPKEKEKKTSERMENACANSSPFRFF